jgi:Kef-type K+ transport system membrane component KefB
VTAATTAAVLLALAVVVAVAQLAGAAARALRQPPVVGEIVAGIALGPSLLGLVAPGAVDALFPADVRPYLQLVAQLGLVVFMLLVGLEVDLDVLRRRRRLVGAVAGSSVALPFALGAGLAMAVYSQHARTASGPVPLLPFALFCGTALAVTAFPVLARIVRDRGLARTPVGAIALASAAVTDVIAWAVLAVVVSLVATGATPPALVLAELAAFTALVLGVVRPLLTRVHRAGLLDRLQPRTVVGLVLVGAVASAWCTQAIGVHAIFGPFLLGLALPRHARTTAMLETRLTDVSTGLLLPCFFVVTGLGVDLTQLDGGALVLLAAALVLAVGGKVVGAAVPARLCGLPRAEALTLGVLLSTRGLTELVVLDVGRSSGLLDPTLFTVLVATAVLTTVATGPLLSLVVPAAAPPLDAHPGAGPEPTADRTPVVPDPRPVPAPFATTLPPPIPAPHPERTTA